MEPYSDPAFSEFPNESNSDTSDPSIFGRFLSGFSNQADFIQEIVQEISMWRYEVRMILLFFEFVTFALCIITHTFSLSKERDANTKLKNPLMS